MAQWYQGVPFFSQHKIEKIRKLLTPKSGLSGLFIAPVRHDKPSIFSVWQEIEDTIDIQRFARENLMAFTRLSRTISASDQVPELFRRGYERALFSVGWHVLGGAKTVSSSVFSSVGKRARERPW